jgi:hypothetical protein
MLARLGPAQPVGGADVIARALGALALMALAVIHVVDLPDTLGPTPLAGIGYLGIIVAALGVSAVLITRSHWLAWAAAGAVAGFRCHQRNRHRHRRLPGTGKKSQAPSRWETRACGWSGAA